MKQLDVVAVVSNPVRYQSRYKLYQDFAKRMDIPHVRLTTVEAAFGDRPFLITEANNPRHVQVRIQDELWQKENLLSIGLSRLPEDAKYVAWIDADIEFLQPNWATETIEYLQHHEVVQLFSHAVDLGPENLGKPIVETHKGFVYQYLQGVPLGFGKGYEFAHPGFCWAARRETLDKMGGLIDRTLLGAADHIMALALVGKVDMSMPGGLHKNYYSMCHRWQYLAETQIKRDIGFVPGTILHHWHGRKVNRGYISRWDILKQNNYDPQVDVMYDSKGVLKLTDNKPKLRDDLRKYFRSRQEDEQTI
jgi:hypothetical protein